MTRNASFIRKVVYISLMALLLIPLSFLSQPSGIDVKKNPGGILDTMRRENDLSLSSLGEVDPTSETMKLATLGMRGVACAILWQQRDEHKKKENWEEYAAVNNQISKLQPHFIGVWTFQSWDESYNVSVEFDDWRMRYHWVKKGIDHIIEGTRYNRRSPKLMGGSGGLAWVFGHKFGRSDERVQFRREFKQDDDFHARLPIDLDDPNLRIRDSFTTTLENGKEKRLIDNWLVGREFYLRSIRIAESPGASKELGMGKVIFYSQPARNSMSYAEAIEEDGYFGQPAESAWSYAADEWNAYGDRDIPTSEEGLSIRLNDLEDAVESAEALSDEHATDPAVAEALERLRNQKIAELPEKERQALEMPPEDRDDEERALAAAAERKVFVSHLEAAENASPEARRRAVRLTELEKRIRFMNSYRRIVNFEYWRTRAQAEQEPLMVKGKELLYLANDLREKAILNEYVDLESGEKRLGAKQAYRKAFKYLTMMFRKYPIMFENPETEDLLDHIQDYNEVLSNLDEELPENFSLQIVREIFDLQGHRRPNSEETVEAWVNANPRRAKLYPPAPVEKEFAATEGNQPQDPRTAAPMPPQPPMGDVQPTAPKDDDPRLAVPRPPQPAGD